MAFVRLSARTTHLISIAFCIGLAAECAADNELVTFRNTMPEPITLWVWNKIEQRWNDPIYLRKGGTVDIAIRSTGSQYLTMRDQAGREVPIGWVDLRLCRQFGPCVGLQPLYHARGRFLGWDSRSGYPQPRWSPIGRAQAVSVTLTPFSPGELLFGVEEYEFVNAQQVPYSRLFPLDTAPATTIFPTVR